MERIIVGVDGSPGSRAALHWAYDEAHRSGAQLNVLLAWHYPAITTIPVYGVAPPLDELKAAAQLTLEKILADEGITSDDTVRVREFLAEGAAAPALLNAAADADLLVVGSRGHGGFVGLLLGSVSHHCVSRAPCPVVVVPVDDAHLDSGNVE